MTEITIERFVRLVKSGDEYNKEKLAALLDLDIETFKQVFKQMKKNGVVTVSESAGFKVILINPKSYTSELIKELKKQADLKKFGKTSL